MTLGALNTDILIGQAFEGRGQKAIADAKAAQNMKKIDEAAEEFEAVFITQMMKPMFEGISTDGMFGGGKGEEIFQDLLLDEYGKLTARTGSIGLADYIKQEMIKLQEVADNGPHT